MATVAVINSTLPVGISSTREPIDGYDLPVYGLDSGQFLQIHIPALVCLSLTEICVICIISLSFILNRSRSFWRWSKSERFVVYIAICDGSFAVSHTMDHAHVTATENHVRPRELCEFYGFMLTEFATAQILMVNIVAINAFLLIYFRKDINFGRYDWRLLTYSFGAPFIEGTVAGITGQYGPTGTYCAFDPVKGRIANILCTTVPLLLILLCNSVLYVLTWHRIHSHVKQQRKDLGGQSTISKASYRSARAMSLFVVAFLVQWWAIGTAGTWALITPPPLLIHQFVTTCSNIGGILNMIVFIIIRRRMIRETRDKSLRLKTISKSRASPLIGNRMKLATIS